MTCVFKRCNDQVTHCDGACHGVNPDGSPMTEIPELSDHLTEDEQRCVLVNIEQQRRIEASEPSIDDVMLAGLYLNWSWPNCGFGQLDVRYYADLGEVHIANEGLNRERVRRLLHKAVDHLVDKAILDS